MLILTRRIGETLHIGDDAGKPKVGDLRITFEAVQTKDGTAVGKQQGNGLVGYTTKADTTVFNMRAGKSTKEQMFASLKSASKNSKPQTLQR